MFHILRVPGRGISTGYCKTASSYACIMAGVRFGLCCTYVLVYCVTVLIAFFSLYFEYDFRINK